MRIVLSQDSDGITLLSNNQSCLLLSGISQIYPIKLLEYHTKQSTGSAHDICDFVTIKETVLNVHILMLASATKMYMITN